MPTFHEELDKINNICLEVKFQGLSPLECLLKVFKELEEEKKNA